MESYFEQSFSGQSFSENEDKKYELVRIGSFSRWPLSSEQYSTKLARAGFFYEGNGDEVVCYLCGVKKSNWQGSDDPIIVHKQLNPTCKYFLSISDNVAVQREATTDSSIIERLENLEIGNLSQLDYGAGTSQNNPPDSTSSSSGERPMENKQCLSKSQSADQVSGSTWEDQGALSFDTDIADSQMSRSTSFPISNARHQDGREKNQSDSITANSSTGSSSINDPTTSHNNNPDSTSAESSKSVFVGAKAYDLSKLRYEKNRLDTFKKWPRHVKVPPQDLAKSGFFYTGIADRVMCVFCKGALRNWDEGDIPNFEHRKHFPKCRMVLGLEVGNVPLAAVPKTPEQLRKEQLSKDMANAIERAKLGGLGIITEKPKHPRYSIYNERLNTFKGWPAGKNQTPEKLAEAGFFYAGFGDNVKCFYCNGGLRNWEPGDVPRNEHAKWFKACPFIKQSKGEAFILQVLQEQKISNSQEPPILTQLNPLETSEGRSVQQKRRNPLQSDLLGLQRVEEREIRARMDSSMVKVVLSMGISREMIARVIRKKLLDEGDDFSSATELMSAVFKLQEEDENREGSEEAEQEESNENQASSQDQSSALMPTEKSQRPNNSTGSEDVTSSENKGSETKKGEDKVGDAGQRSENNETKKSVDDLEKENIDLKEQRLCKICMVADSSIVFLPCGHLVACAACSPALENCPICRVPIQGFVRTFIA